MKTVLSFKILNILLIFVAFLALLLTTNYLLQTGPVAHAQVDPSIITEVNKQGLVPCGNPGQSKCNLTHIFFLFGRLTNWLVAMAGLFATFQIVRASFSMAFANGDAGAIKTATKGLTEAVIGLVLCLIAYLLVNTILLGILGIKTNGKDLLTAPFEYICPKQSTTANGNVTCY